MKKNLKLCFQRFLFKIYLNSVSSTNIHRNFLELSQVVQRDKKCLAPVKPRFLFLALPWCLVQIKQYLNSLNNIVATFFAFALGFSMRKYLAFTYKNNKLLQKMKM